MPFASGTATRPDSSQSATKQAWLKSEDQFSEALSNATNSLPVTGDDTGKNTLRDGMNRLKNIKAQMARLAIANSKHDVVSLALPLFAISNATEWLIESGNPLITSPSGSGKPDLAEAFSALRAAVTIGWLSKYGESVLDPSRSLKDPLHVDDMALQSLIDCATREDVWERQAYDTSSFPVPMNHHLGISVLASGTSEDGDLVDPLAELVVARKDLKAAEDALFLPSTDKH